MEHPLIGDLSKLTEDQVTEKLTELNKKLSIAARLGNGHMCNQIRSAIESYRTRYNTILDQIRKDSDDKFGKKIDIS